MKSARGTFAKCRDWFIRLLAKHQIKSSVALGVLVVSLIAGGFMGHQVNHVVVHDAAFCLSCHVHDYAQDAWVTSIHNSSNSTCHDCHHQSLYDNVRGAVQLVSPFHKQGEMVHHIPVVQNEHCAKCHLPHHEESVLDVLGPISVEQIRNTVKIDETRLHQVHLKSETREPRADWQTPKSENEPTAGGDSAISHSEGAINCRDCHGGEPNRAHNFTASQANCSQCHKNPHANDAHAHNSNCLSCHVIEFIAKRE